MNLPTNKPLNSPGFPVHPQAPEIVRTHARLLQQAYLEGQARSFLDSLQTLLRDGLQSRAVRRCLRIASAGARLADRLGATDSAIACRCLQAGYHLDRNEVWVAAERLREAVQLAESRSSPDGQRLASLLSGASLLKQGQIQAGLTAIASVDALPDAWLVFGPVAELRRYLEVLGIEQSSPFSITLTPDRVPDLVASVERQREAAQSAGLMPWDGRHCAISVSSAFDADYTQRLCTLGALEFDGERTEAILLTLDLASHLLQHGYDDATWLAENLLANPNLTGLLRGRAWAILAEAQAGLGQLQRAAAAFAAAEQAHAEAGVALPFATAEAGLWLALQSGETDSSLRWSRLLDTALRDHPRRDALRAAVASQLATWGELPRAVSETFGASATPPSTAVGSTPSPFRRFTGATADLHATTHTGVSVVLQEAQAALIANQPERALELLDALATPTESIPDHQTGALVALQVQALSAKLTPAALDETMNNQRRVLLGQLAFSSLARLEAAVAWAALTGDQPELAAQVVARHGFIAEFADDPLARISLTVWEAWAASLGQDRDTRSEPIRRARQLAGYFGVPEALLFPAEDAHPSPSSEPPLPHCPPPHSGDTGKT